MTYEGAKEQTAKEIQSVFYIPEDDNVRQTKYKQIYDEINKKINNTNSILQILFGFKMILFY